MIDKDKYAYRLERAGDWIAMLDHRGISSEKRAEFQEWLSDAVNRRAFDDMLCLWNDYEALAGLAHRKFPGVPENLQACIANRGEESHRNRPARTKVPGLAVAASLAAVISLFVWQLMPYEPDMPTLRTGKGEYYEAVLEDGSNVRLNTATVVDVLFSHDERRILLKSGEAYFSVARDPGRPFIVEAERGLIRALGTAFNVKTSADRVELTVVEGVVEVTNAHPDAVGRLAIGGISSAPNLRVAGGQSLTYGKSFGPVEDIPGQKIRRLTAWQNGRVYFEDMPLKEIVAELNRYTETEIVIAGSGLEGITGGGVFHTRDVGAFLHGLELALPLKVLETQSNIIALIPDPSRRTATGKTLDSSGSPRSPPPLPGRPPVR